MQKNITGICIYGTKNNETKILPLNNRTPSNLKDALVFETSQDIVNAEHLELLITIRNKRYIIQMK